MISQIVMIIALISIWLSLAWGLVILFSAVHFWFKHSDFRVNTDPLPHYGRVRRSSLLDNKEADPY